MSYQERKTVKDIVTIFFVTVLFAVGGYASSYLAKPEWKAEAQIVRPSVKELGNYYSLFSIYHLVKGQKEDERAVDMVYKELNRQLSSYDTISHFWQNSEFYKQKMSGNNQDDAILLNDLIQSVQLSTLNSGVNTISLTLDNPKQANELLRAWMGYVNTVTRDIVYAELISQWQTLFNQINTATQLNLGRIQQGLSIDTQDWQGKLNMMKSVSALDNNLVAFRFIKSPMQPLHENISHRVQTTIVGSVIGLFFGVILVVLLNRRTKKEE